MERTLEKVMLSEVETSISKRAKRVYTLSLLASEERGLDFIQSRLVIQGYDDKMGVFKTLATHKNNDIDPSTTLRMTK